MNLFTKIFALALIVSSYSFTAHSQANPTSTSPETFFNVKDYEPWGFIYIDPTFTGLEYTPQNWSGDAFHPNGIPYYSYADFYKAPYLKEYPGPNSDTYREFTEGTLSIQFQPAEEQLVKHLYAASTHNPFKMLFSSYYHRANMKTAYQWWQLATELDNNAHTKEWLITFPDACLKSGAEDSEETIAHISLLQRQLDGHYKVLLAANDGMNLYKTQKKPTLDTPTEEFHRFNIGLTYLSRTWYATYSNNNQVICDGLSFGYHLPPNQQAVLLAVNIYGSTADSCSDKIQKKPQESGSEYVRRLYQHTFKIALPWLKQFTGKDWTYNPETEELTPR